MPVWSIAAAYVSPSIPTQAEAAPLTFGAGIVKRAETAVNVLPAGGVVRIAPAQFEDKVEWLLLPFNTSTIDESSRLEGVLFRRRGIIGSDTLEQALEKSVA